MQDHFAEIARDYDRMFLRDIEADRRMLLALLDRHVAKTVLDCACGTGVHTKILAAEGLSVVGSDASGPMLEVARSKLSEAGLKAELFKAYWRDLPREVPGRYDAVICMGNSLQLELDDASVVASLEGMYAMLNEGGFLLVSNTNVDRHLPDMEVVEPELDSFLLLVRDFGPGATRHRFFFIDTTGEEPEMRHYTFELNNLTAAKTESLARQAGVDSYRLYGDKDLNPYSPLESERLIFVAEKRTDGAGG
jgi:glycine/sarcosine N-methyltransferase